MEARITGLPYASIKGTISSANMVLLAASIPSMATYRGWEWGRETMMSAN